MELNVFFKKGVLLLAGMITHVLVYAQNPIYFQEFNCLGYNDICYGEFVRNKFDILLPNNNEPHGLAIFIHGGGFQHGDKKVLYKRVVDIKYLLENNIAVATVNYRFYSNTDSLGVKVCLNDVKRAIQYLKFHAGEYNIDKNRVGCFGVSAGAGSSLYLAFHDDMAQKGDTTFRGESTRLKCAGAIATQSTYDVFKWKKIIPYMPLVVLLKRKMFYNSAANFYGFPDYKSFKKYKKEIPASLDMLAMIGENDPPIYLMNTMEQIFPKNDNIIQHHKKHAIVVSKKLDQNNVRNYLFTSANELEKGYSIAQFLVEYLK